MNDVIHKIDGFRSPVVAYTDTDSIYIPLSVADKLIDITGNDLFQGKNDYGEGKFITKALFCGPKVKYMVMNNGEEEFSFKGIDKRWWNEKDPTEI